MGNAAGFRLAGVSVDYPSTRALDGIDLVIEPGETVGFVGPSGSGKTTLLSLLNGSEWPTRGKVEVAGRDLAGRSRRELQDLRSRIGFVRQDLGLVPNLRVIHNVVAGRLGRWSFATSLREMLSSKDETIREVHQLLEKVGIPDKLFERTDRLSGGQQQRVAIARALFQRPLALIADEPVSRVDPARARDTLELLTQISREEGIALVMSLHDFELARTHLSRLIGLRSGRVVFDDRSDAIRDEQIQALYVLESEEFLQDEG